MRSSHPKRLEIIEDRRAKPETSGLHEWDVRLWDAVEVNCGAEEGARGRIIQRKWLHNQVVVEDVNVKEKYVFDEDGGGTPFAPKFKVEKTPQPIHFTHVSLIDPSLDKRVEVRWEERDGRRVRVSSESGAEIPILREKPGPEIPKEYADKYSSKRTDVLEVTYKPFARAAPAAPPEAATGTAAPPPENEKVE